MLDNLSWSKELPKQAGWYWFRPDHESRMRHGDTMLPVFRQGAAPVVLNVWFDNSNSRYIASFPSKKVTVVSLGGEWCGPLPLPKSQ